MNRLIDFGSRFRILKGGKISLVVSALLGSAVIANAAPSGGVVTSGSANISQSGNTTNIVQNTNKVSINWNKFNIASNETVNFKQPNVNSIALNRVIGNEKSIINGALNANGQVWILNSNGVLFGKNAKINTAGLLATTKNLSDEDFNAGNYNFKGNSSESVINLGEIDISDSGYATLLANKVSNEGTIKAVKGSVRLVGADEVTINLNGNSIVDLTVNKGVLDSLVENKGAIYSNGGEIYLTTNAVNELLKGVVNNTGIIEADSFEGVTGHVELFAHGGEVQVGGTISAKEGFVETSGKDFTIDKNTVIEAKTWLIDPVNITIDDNLATAIETQLGSGNVTIETETSSSSVDTSANESGNEGNIYVNSNITWSEATKLTLNAVNNIYMNAIIENTNTTNGGVYFQARDTRDAVIFDANAKVIINNAYQLQWMNTALNGNYELGSNIDLSSMNWNPIGNSWNSASFSGSFNGLNHTISNLIIDNNDSDTGLFGSVNNAVIKNLILDNFNIKGSYNVGALIGVVERNGHIENVSVKNSSVEGNQHIGGLIGLFGNSIYTVLNSHVINSNIKGIKLVGGLVGLSYYSNITNSSFQNGRVTGAERYVGGLVGAFEGGTIENSYATGNVTGKNKVGGLVGNNYGDIINSYATGDISGDESVGGVVGSNYYGLIENSYATGAVSGDNIIGGLVGVSYRSEIINSYSTGDISGDESVGGLVGSNNYGLIKNSYATGDISGDESVGGLVGYNDDYSDIKNSYYDKTVNKNMVDEENSGKTTAQLQDINTFKDGSKYEWDIVEDPTIAKGTPILSWQVGKDGDMKPIWLIGTKVESTTPPTPTTETPTPNINKAIAAIVNQESVTIPRPPQVTTPNNSRQNTNVSFSIGENRQVVSRPVEGQPTRIVSMSEARQMQQEATGQPVSEVRVPLSRSSIIALINGGVLLPGSLEQQFFVSENDK